jgi:hypothetical protein
MKSFVSALAACVLLFPAEVRAEDRTLNDFTFSVPFNADPGFIENRFGFKQLVTPSLPISGGLTAFTMGEQVAVDIKLHDYIGVSGKFLGSFQAGGSSAGDDYHLAAGYAIKADGSINVKFFRAEEIGAQWIFHIKASYRKNQGILADTGGVAINFDNDYYKDLVGKKNIKPEEVADHFKADLKKTLKESLSKLTTGSQATYVSGGGSVSWIETFNHNFAMQASSGLMIGPNTIKIGDVESPAIQSVEYSAGIAGYVSLDPITPITFCIEYEHTVVPGSKNNLVLASLIFNKKNSPIAVTASAGRYSIGDENTPIGAVGIDLYF